jgi:hypothetical protein
MTKPAPSSENLLLEGGSPISKQRHTSLARSSTSCREVKLSEGQAVVSFCMRAVFLGAGSSAVAAGTNNVAAIITTAALCGIIIISAFIVIIVQLLNRDASIIDARTRSTMLRRWGRSASTPTEIEHAVASAIMPMVLAREDMHTDAERVIELLQSRRPL